MENNARANKKIGVVLMTYGSATTADHVREYMEHIYHSKLPKGIVEDFENRYRLVGHSPLVDITQQQAKLLEENLGESYIVRAGMLHSEPFIATAMDELKLAGTERCIGIILSPQFSSFIMEGYRTAFTRAAEDAGFSKEGISVAGPWPTEPHFVTLLANRIKNKRTPDMTVIFTTHSLPKRVVEKDPSYLDQLNATIQAVVTQLDDPALKWTSGYQSAGHTPEEWLKPDLTDILGELKEKNIHDILIVPIQFLTDHLEILYDLDIAAREQCEGFEIAYRRIELPNTDPLFIEALAAIIKSF